MIRTGLIPEAISFYGQFVEQTCNIKDICNHPNKHVIFIILVLRNLIITFIMITSQIITKLPNYLSYTILFSAIFVLSLKYLRSRRLVYLLIISLLSFQNAYWSCFIKVNQFFQNLIIYISNRDRTVVFPTYGAPRALKNSKTKDRINFEMASSH